MGPDAGSDSVAQIGAVEGILSKKIWRPTRPNSARGPALVAIHWARSAAGSELKGDPSTPSVETYGFNSRSGNVACNEGIERANVILQVLADIRDVEDGSNPEGSEVSGWANSGAKKNARSAIGASGKDNLNLGGQCLGET